jgi:hypothetical protein
MTFAHLRRISPDVARALDKSREACNQGEESGLEFEDGRCVTAELFDEFVLEYVQKRLKTDVSLAFEAFQAGLFGWKERFTGLLALRAICSGVTAIDWGEFRRSHTLEGYSRDDIPVKLFWDEWEKLTEQEKTNLLWFITGSKRSPPGGFSSKPITLSRWNPATSRHPVAHTCSRTLDLPMICDRRLMSGIVKSFSSGCGGAFTNA